jgi:hypothetical protein
MDGAQFRNKHFQQHNWEEEPTNGDLNFYMYMYCNRLERLSVKNVTSRLLHEEEQPVSQAMIIKFVRHTPTLRWLRSDLTEENVAMLQQERPDVTFVTDFWGS